MNFNPNIHHRRSIRLRGYDYSQAGLYAITICCQDRAHRFGHVAVGAPLVGARFSKENGERNTENGKTHQIRTPLSVIRYH
mgnify:CR=1 FL=1